MTFAPNVRTRALRFWKSTDSAELVNRLKTLKAQVDEMRAQAVNDSDDAIAREKVTVELVPAIKDLMLTCGLEEVF